VLSETKVMCLGGCGVLPISKEADPAEERSAVE